MKSSLRGVPPCVKNTCSICLWQTSTLLENEVWTPYGSGMENEVGTPRRLHDVANTFRSSIVAKNMYIHTYVYIYIYTYIQLYTYLYTYVSKETSACWISISRCPLRHLGRPGHGAHVDAPGTAAARRGSVGGGSAAGVQWWATDDALATRSRRSRDGMRWFGKWGWFLLDRSVHIHIHRHIYTYTYTVCVWESAGKKLRKDEGKGEPEKL